METERKVKLKETLAQKEMALHGLKTHHRMQIGSCVSSLEDLDSVEAFQ